MTDQSMPPPRKPPRKHTSSTNVDTAALAHPQSTRLWSLAAFLFGTLIVWSGLAPVDATSVFLGEAIPQNLGWLLLALVTSVAAARSGIRLRFGPADWSIVGACLVWMVVSAVLAGRENNPRIAWNGFWQVISLASCYFSAGGLLSGTQARQAMVQLLIAVSLALSCHGLFQVLVTFPSDRAAYEADPDRVLQVAGIDAPAGTADRKRFEDRLYSPEPYASFALANSLATLLSGGLFLMFGLAFSGFRDRAQDGNSNGKSIWQRAWWWLQSGANIALLVALAVTLSCWFLTRSRTAYLALMVGVGLWLLSSGNRLKISRRQLRAGAVGIGIAGALAILWLVRNDSLVLSEAPKSIAYRLEYWLATLSMLGDHGWFGVGLGNFQSYYPQYKLATASEIVADPHNWILDIAATLSIPIAAVIVLWLAKQFLSPPTNAEALPKPVDATDPLIARYLLLGSLLGGALCAIGLCLLSGFDSTNLVVAWVPAILVSRGLWPLAWRMERSSLREAARGAAVTVVLCLLASGSWQASGIAVPLLVCIRLGQTGILATETTRRVAWGRWTGCVLPAIGLACFLIQCWRPTTASWSLLQQALATSQPARRLELMQAAAQADPLDCEPLSWTARLLTEEAAAATPGRFVDLAKESVNAFTRWLERDSTKYVNWQFAGTAMLDLAAAAQNRGIDPLPWLEQASGYFAEAARRYPSDARLHAQLAACRALENKWISAHSEAVAATRLSAATPHADKQLSSQRLWLPLLPEGAEGEFRQLAPWVPAEPFIDWLRKQDLGN